ncbi:hypothetical protein BDR07DRAFT_43246 [Suillus spraguei]|nr:hypothetical protein BDR07DRAFT_43246 [Suillus spraguei]
MFPTCSNLRVVLGYEAFSMYYRLHCPTYIGYSVFVVLFVELTAFAHRILDYFFSTPVLVNATILAPAPFWYLWPSQSTPRPPSLLLLDCSSTSYTLHSAYMILSLVVIILYCTLISPSISKHENFASDALERSGIAFNALKYTCHNWATHLSHVPSPYGMITLPSG